MLPIVPSHLYHYFEAATGPFRSLSDLADEAAESLLEDLRAEGKVFAGRRSADYMSIRRDLEHKVRETFIRKGGHPRRLAPHYMTLGPCRWLLEWYEEGCELAVPLGCFPPDAVSFTYGDTFPAMRYMDGKPYRGQVYVLEEMANVIQAYGLPQDWNPSGGLGPERYIEAQVWDDAPLERYR